MKTLKEDGTLPKGPVTESWAMLTREDFEYVKGQHDEWLTRIQKRTGKTRAAIEQAIDGFLSPRSISARASLHLGL